MSYEGPFRAEFLNFEEFSKEFMLQAAPLKWSEKTLKDIVGCIVINEEEEICQQAENGYYIEGSTYTVNYPIKHCPPNTPVTQDFDSLMRGLSIDLNIAKRPLVFDIPLVFKVHKIEKRKLKPFHLDEFTSLANSESVATMIHNYLTNAKSGRNKHQNAMS